MARVLVTDDDRGFCEFAVDLLTLDGHEVERAFDGIAATEALRRSSFHVLVADLRMGRMDGMTLIKTMRDEQPELEIIVMTAHGTVERAVEALGMGVSHYLQKPLVSNKELRTQVARAAERER